MTPLQKLVRLQDIERELDQGGPDYINAAELRAERTALLAGAHRPPAELFTRVEPSAWAESFAEHFASVSAEASVPWFGGAMSVAYNSAREVGRQEGAKSGAQAVQNLINEVQLILQLDARRQIRLGNVRDTTSPDAPPESMAERLRRALQLLGIEPLTGQ